MTNSKKNRPTTRGVTEITVLDILNKIFKPRKLVPDDFNMILKDAKIDHTGKKKLSETGE